MAESSTPAAAAAGHGGTRETRAGSRGRGPRRRGGRGSRANVTVSLPPVTKRALLIVNMQVRGAVSSLTAKRRISTPVLSSVFGSGKGPLRSARTSLWGNGAYHFTCDALQNDFGANGAFPADGCAAAVHQVNQLRARVQFDTVFVVTTQHAPNHCTFVNANPVSPTTASMCAEEFSRRCDVHVLQCG